MWVGATWWVITTSHQHLYNPTLATIATWRRSRWVFFDIHFVRPTLTTNVRRRGFSIFTYCLFHVTLPSSQSQHISPPIFGVSFLAQYSIESSENLYIALDMCYLGAPSTRSSNLFFSIFRFFTHSYIYLPESNVSCTSSNKLYGPKKIIYTL